jgi:hypothetical protein
VNALATASRDFRKIKHFTAEDKNNQQNTFRGFDL